MPINQFSKITSIWTFEASCRVLTVMAFYSYRLNIVCISCNTAKMQQSLIDHSIRRWFFLIMFSFECMFPKYFPALISTLWSNICSDNCMYFCRWSNGKKCHGLWWVFSCFFPNSAELFFCSFVWNPREQRPNAQFNSWKRCQCHYVLLSFDVIFDAIFSLSCYSVIFFILHYFLTLKDHFRFFSNF